MAHDHSHAHDGHHHHGHTHVPGDDSRPFLIGIALNLGFVVAEVAFGLISGSLALLADAGHNLGDVLGLILAAGASRLARRRPTARHTYGWGRSTILAALCNAGLLLVAVGGIAWEAVQRLGQPQPVASTTVIWVALAGVLINGATAALFAGHSHDLNRRGAFLHMLADAAVSAGVVICGLTMRATGWFWLDPLVSLLVALTILYGTWGLLRESLALALDAVPAQVDPTAVALWLGSQPGVVAVHDLHIWAMSTTDTALTAHVVKPDAAGDDALLTSIGAGLRQQFGIGHITLQWERELDCPAGNHCPPPP